MATKGLRFDSRTGSTVDDVSLKVVLYRFRLKTSVSTTWQLAGVFGHNVMAFLTLGIVANPSTKVTTKQHTVISSPVLMADN